MDEDRFWQMIEDAWAANGGLGEERLALSRGELPDDQVDGLMELAGDVVTNLRDALENLSQEELLAFDRVLEIKLWQIDREEIHEFTDGGDDGFLYNRGFIVAAGRDYYEAVDSFPERGRMDVDCEDITYLPHEIYRKKFGPMPKSDISRETGSNKMGWTEP